VENQDAASSESNSLPCPWKCSRGNVATLTLVTFLSLFPVSAQDRIDSFADSAPARIATLHVDRAGSEKRLARALCCSLVLASRASLKNYRQRVARDAGGNDRDNALSRHFFLSKFKKLGFNSLQRRPAHQ
jgi:hypothetical protein